MNDVERPSAGFGTLVETEWLASELGAPDLRVFDCMVFLYPLPYGSGQRAESGRAAWEAGHIPTKMLPGIPWRVSRARRTGKC